MSAALATRLASAPVPAGARPHAARWVQIVSHLDPRFGGLSTAVPELARSLTQLREPRAIEVSLAAFCAPGEHFHPAGFDGGHLSFWPVSRKSWLQDAVTGMPLRHALRDRLATAEGLHIHGLWEHSTAVAASTARSLKLPYVLSAHGMLEPWALAQSRLKKKIYAGLIERKNVAHATVLHALTQAEARHFIRFGARSPIAVIPNAVEVPGNADPTLFLNRNPVLQGKRLVLFMARLHPKKGLDMLLEAWSSLTANNRNAVLVLAGPDSEGTQARLQHFIATNLLGDSVFFAGMLRGAMKWSALAAAEAFVLPSFSEGLSVAVLEAMGIGLPVLVTDPCNMPEVAQFHAGWQIPAAVEPLRTALAALLRNAPSENQQIGTRGAALIQSRYTWPIVARQMAEVYRFATGGPKPSSLELIFPN